MDLSQSRRQVENSSDSSLDDRIFVGSFFFDGVGWCFLPFFEAAGGRRVAPLDDDVLLGTQGFLHLVLGADGVGRLEVSLVRVFAASFASSLSTSLWYLIMC